MTDIIPYAEQLLSNYTDYSDIINNDAFLPAFLLKNVGRWMKVQLLYGNSPVTHIGRLYKVGVDYMVLQLEASTAATLICNIKDVKLITIIYDTNIKNLGN